MFIRLLMTTLVVLGIQAMACRDAKAALTLEFSPGELTPTTLQVDVVVSAVGEDETIGSFSLPIQTLVPEITFSTFTRNPAYGAGRIESLGPPFSAQSAVSASQAPAPPTVGVGETLSLGILEFRLDGYDTSF